MIPEPSKPSIAAAVAATTRPERRTSLEAPRSPRIDDNLQIGRGELDVDTNAALRPGDRLPGTPYFVLGPLGQGGMGEVVLVEHTELRRRFAVKMLHRRYVGRRDLEARMRDEARSLAALRHPNLVEVFDLGTTTDGRLYFAMDALYGHDLRRELSRFGVIAVPAALGFIAQALDGLAAAHKAGVIHRDIKLENLFLCDDGSLKILDFGIAKVSRDREELTPDGPPAGTLRCMAPEQHASAPVDHRTDLYSAGLALYELVVGRGPFDEHRGNAAALRFAHCERTPPRPSELAPQVVPTAVDEVILRSIAKSPADRFQSASEMADALRRARTMLSAEPTALGASRTALGALRANAYEPTLRDERAAAKQESKARTRTRPYHWGPSPAVAALTTLMVAVSTIGSAFAELVPRRF